MVPIILLILICIVLPVASVTAVHIASKNKLNKMMKNNSDLIELKSSKVYEDEVEGLKYEYVYHAGSKNRAASLKLMIQRESAGKFSIRPESKIDRYFKNLRISTEIQTGDIDFDRAFYVESENVGFITKYFANQEKREAVKRIFAQNFRKINHNGKIIEIIMTPAKMSYGLGGSLIDKDILLKAAGDLMALGENIPVYFPEIFVTLPHAWKAKKIFIMSVAIAAIVLGITATIMGLFLYVPLDGWKVLVFSLQYSLVSFALFMILSVNMLKGRASSHKELITVFFTALIGFITLANGAVSLANGYLDVSESVYHQAEVVRKYVSRSSKNNDTYYIYVESWREGRRTEKFQVSSSVYYKIAAHRTTMHITTRSGKLGFEWKEKYSFEY